MTVQKTLGILEQALVAVLGHGDGILTDSIVTDSIAAFGLQ